MRNLSRVGAAVIISTAALMAACNQQTEDSHATSPSTSAAAVAKTMHPSWDADQDGINDCENDGSCDHTVDYSQPRPSIAPTFDCTKTDSSIETLICQDSELAALDIKLAAVYAAASQKVQEQEQQSPLLTTGQRGWIKGRNDCWKADDKKGCAKTEYQRRIAELQAHVKGRLAPYEYPKEIEFIDALPMTTTGKVQRRVLRLQEEARAALRA